MAASASCDKQLDDSETGHILYYLGVIELESTILSQLNENAFYRNDDSNSGVRRSTEQKFIDYIEQAQLTGGLPERPSTNTPNVRVSVNGTGMKIIDANTGAVVERLPLHKIVQSVAYNDENEDAPVSNVIVVVKRKNFGNRGGDLCHLLQAASSSGAAHVCQELEKAFDSVKADVSERNSFTA